MRYLLVVEALTDREAAVRQKGLVPGCVKEGTYICGQNTYYIAPAYALRDTICGRVFDGVIFFDGQYSHDEINYALARVRRVR